VKNAFPDVAIDPAMVSALISLTGDGPNAMDPSPFNTSKWARVRRLWSVSVYVSA
jgi:hypothetical protein